jgi:hypothetical protein
MYYGSQNDHFLSRDLPCLSNKVVEFSLKEWPPVPLLKFLTEIYAAPDKSTLSNLAKSTLIHQSQLHFIPT